MMRRIWPGGKTRSRRTSVSANHRRHMRRQRSNSMRRLPSKRRPTISMSCVGSISSCIARPRISSSSLTASKTFDATALDPATTLALST